MNTRRHIVGQFNKGVYDILIPSDENSDGPAKQPPKKQQSKRRHATDGEYGVSRGIDFHGVCNVVNFDFPPTPESYVHRVGR